MQWGMVQRTQTLQSGVVKSMGSGTRLAGSERQHHHLLTVTLGCSSVSPNLNFQLSNGNRTAVKIKWGNICLAHRECSKSAGVIYPSAVTWGCQFTSLVHFPHSWALGEQEYVLPFMLSVVCKGVSVDTILMTFWKDSSLRPNTKLSHNRIRDTLLWIGSWQASNDGRDKWHEQGWIILEQVYIYYMHDLKGLLSQITHLASDIQLFLAINTKLMMKSC